MLKPISDNAGRFGIAIFDQRGNYQSPSHQFAGKDFASAELAQKAIDKARKQFDHNVLGMR